MTKFELERIENEAAKKQILEINEEHPHYMDEAMSVFLHETTWGKKVNAVVSEAYEYLEKNDAMLDDARENGNESETDMYMYEYLHKLIYADFCKKHTEMQKAFCIWAHNSLEWDCFGWYGLKSPFSETEE